MKVVRKLRRPSVCHVPSISAWAARGDTKSHVYLLGTSLSVEKALKGKVKMAAPVASDAHGEVEEARVVYRRDYSQVSDEPVSQFGSQGSRVGQFKFPSSVACTSRGEIVVADCNNHRVQVFNRNGKFLFKIGGPKSRNGNSQFSFPSGVTVDQRNNNQIVVADSWNHRIQVFDEKGTFLRVLGSSGNGDGQFAYPYSVVVDQQGNYVVTDKNKHRIQILTCRGEFVRKFGSNGEENGQMKYPCGVGVLSNGNIVVSEYSGERLQIFDSQGNFVRIVGAGQFKNPYHLFVDSDDNILVAD